jgi:hypothetical protein
MLHKINQERLNSFLLGLVALLILLNGISTFRNNRIIIQNNQLKEQIESVKQVTTSVLTRLVQATDVAVRGYALTEQEVYVKAFDFLYQKQKNIYPPLIATLDSLGVDLSGIKRLEKGTLAYIDFSMDMINEVKAGDMDTFKAMLAEGRGDQLYEVYVEASNDIFAHMDRLNEEAVSNYAAALWWNKWLQVALLAISLPTIVSVILRTRKETRTRVKLYKELAQNNYRHLFNPGRSVTEDQNYQLADVLNTSIENMRQASDFVTHIAEGNYDVQWTGLNEENRDLNQTTLAGALVKMREKMKNAKEADRKHLWVTDGLTKFSTLVRNYQHDPQRFADEVIAFLVNYLGAQQGGLFAVNGDDDDLYLRLEASYAFDKKRFVEKTIKMGNGLVGQAYLEKKPIVLTRVPEGYTHITSGLGDATPRCLMIMPFVYNEKVEAVVELASFEAFAAYQQEFLAKAGEFVASALISLKTSEKMQFFVQEAKEKSEQMRAQEEELRQNMEEMASTQEEMQRREQELLQRLADKE